MDPNIKLRVEGSKLLEASSSYRQLIGRLLYRTVSGSDIMFAVHKLCQYVVQPRQSNLTAPHTLLRYLKRTPGQGRFPKTSNSFQITASSDANLGSCLDLVSL